MNSSITIPCACGKQINLEISGSGLPEYARCAACKASIYLVAPLGNIVTGLMMERAKQELANGDTTIAILLSAMAVEGEMAYLFFKWKGVDLIPSGISPNKAEQDKWEYDWAGMRSIGKRLDELSRFLTDRNFDAFALQNKSLLATALSTHDPATSLKEFFQEQFFEKRNRIAHYSMIDFPKSDGERCFSLALSLLRLLNAMDKQRMDEAHKAVIEPGPANIA